MRRRRRMGLVAAMLLVATTARAEPLIVLAAASLTDAFRTIARDYEAAHPGTRVELNFAGSSTLVRQILEGAPADVFASADEENMQKASAELADTPQVFARNRLAIIVPKGNPKKVTSLADLGRQSLTIALAASAVPVGRHALEAFAKAKATPPAGTNEIDVKAVVTRVATGEADAGIVYTTDAATASDKVETVAIPDAHNVIARYPIASLKGGKNAGGARGFVAYVLSASGRRTLEAAGFLGP